MNEQLEYNVGEGEQPATVQVPMEDETPSLPQVSNEAASDKSERELDDYSDKVKKRIDKLTARLRETQRREQAAFGTWILPPASRPWSAAAWPRRIPWST